jgi:DNA-binding transcriptional ArsR family regulator
MKDSSSQTRLGSMMNRDELTAVIGEGRDRGLSNAEIADRILALAENDATWAKALSHPLRGRILRTLRGQGSLSPVGAARALDQPVGTIAYHFRQLDKLGFIEICDEIQRRGATEHVYRLTRPATGWPESAATPDALEA